MFLTKEEWDQGVRIRVEYGSADYSSQAKSSLPLAFINSLLEHSYTYMFMYFYSHGSMAELNSCNRVHMAYSVFNIYCLALHRKKILTTSVQDKWKSYLWLGPWRIHSGSGTKTEYMTQMEQLYTFVKAFFSFYLLS